MVYKCKVCGGQTTIDSNSGIITCDYCGTKQVIPLFSDDSAKTLYERGNNYLSHNEFDKAENIYNQLISIAPAEPELYWNLVLCKYGVTFVCDPKTNKYIPTCNRTHFQSVFDDENYLNALKYSDEAKREFYKTNAEIIDKIQHDVLAISKKEKPFDIFISYKETDVNGYRSQDSVVAQDLYEKLTAQGYKVFYSRITLEDKIGTQYEPYIYAALYSSKVMLTISSTKENIEAPWVKNEWSRYLAFAQSKGDKTLIPLYFDMEKEELPADFAHLPSYDMKMVGFEQELIRGIKKLIPTPIVYQEKKKKRNRILKYAGMVAVVLLVIAGICAVPWFKKLPEYDAAMQLYYDKNYPQAAWAFEAMGGYRDSEEMQQKCVDSWRRNVATIATDNILSSSSAGAYYVTANGTVESFDYAPGVAADSLDISEHGKIISIGDNYSLYALYEDGYVFNSATNNGLDADWEDIVQITPVFNATNLALTTEGKILYGELESKHHGRLGDNDVLIGDRDDWLCEVLSWDKIVSLDCCFSRFGVGGLQGAVIAAVDADGCVHIVAYDAQNNSIFGEEIEEFFSNVKEIDVSVTHGYSNHLQDYATMINAVALTTDGKILSYIDGVYNEYEANDVVDVEISYEYDADSDKQFFIYELHADGTLYRSDSKNYILADVVYLNNGFFVTRSGSICVYSYNYESNTLELSQTNGKTKVHNEWIERFN